MKLSIFSIIAGTFFKYNSTPITGDTLKQFEEDVSKAIGEKFNGLSPISGIKIMPELVTSEDHNGDVMVKDVAIFIETAQDTRTAALQLVDKERDRQDGKWGEQNHLHQFWTGILGEEYGEYCQAVNETVFNNGEAARQKGGYDNMMKELSHVAAVAVGAMESLMRAKAQEGGEKDA